MALDTIHKLAIIVERPDGSQHITRVKTDRAPLMQVQDTTDLTPHETITLQFAGKVLELALEDTRETGWKRCVEVPPRIVSKICQNCNKPIVGELLSSRWTHKDTGIRECYPIELVAVPVEDQS